MRSIGMDVHRSFAQVAILDGGKFTGEFRVELEHDAVVAFGQSLRKDDEVVLEATGNTAAIVRLLTPFTARVVIANPLQVKAIAHARVKTDKVDAKILAQLHAAGFLPEVWAADDETQNLRRLVSERAALVRSIRRVKSRVQAVLHANLVPKFAGHLFGKGGRSWLATAPLPKAERDLLARHLDELDWLNGKLATLDKALARISLDDARSRKLMAIAGISSVIGDRGHQLGDCHGSHRGNRGHLPFCLTRQAGELFRTDTTDPAVRRSRCHSWPDLEARQCDCQNDADRGRLVGGFGAGPAACLLPADQGPQGSERCSGRHRAQDRGPDLAIADEGSTLSVGSARLRRHEDAQVGTARRRCQGTRAGRTGPRLLDQGASPSRDGARRPSRGRLRANGRGLDGQATQTQGCVRKGLFNNIRVQLQNAVIEVWPEALHAGQGIANGHGEGRLS